MNTTMPTISRAAMSVGCVGRARGGGGRWGGGLVMGERPS